MIRAITFLAAVSAAAIASSGSAQSHHSGHGAEQAKEQAAAACTPEHAAMGHCSMEAEPAKAPELPEESRCTPEHAAMGHCVAAPVTPVETSTATGTDLPAGDAPAPPPPGDWYADRLFSKAEMDRARHVMMHENGAMKVAFLGFDLAEYQARKGEDGYRWDAEGRYGGDIDRVVLKSEGEGEIGHGLEHAETQLLYSRAIGPYFDLQAGVRQDLGEGPDRTYAVVGVEGLAPYWFEVEGMLFASIKGDLHARIEGQYDQRLTQKLILQPAVEANFAAQDVPELGIGSGLSDIELGLRLRYEFVKEFAPYVGVEWTRKFGDTARFARAVGEETGGTSLVAGVRFWF